MKGQLRRINGRTFACWNHRPSCKGAPMSLDDVKRRFVEEVKLRAYDDKYIDRGEEREILQIAIQQGVGVDAARGALVQVCDSQGYVLESQVIKGLKETLETFAENDGVVSEKEFNDTVTICKKKTQGKRTEPQCKKMVVELIEEANYKTKQGMFNHWYDKIKKEVGV